MNKTYFELRESSCEIRIRHHHDISESIYPGCVTDVLIREHANCSSSVIARFDSENEARAALSDRETFIRDYGNGLISVEECWIEENTYSIDEDGDEEWIDGGDVCEYSAMPEVVHLNGCAYRWDSKFHYTEIEEGADD